LELILIIILLGNINDPITMDEIQNTVLDTENNKAPGPDSIPMEFFKAFFSKSDLFDNQDDSSGCSLL